MLKRALVSAVEARAAAGDHKVSFANLPEISRGVGTHEEEPVLVKKRSRPGRPYVYPRVSPDPQMRCHTTK